VQSPINPCSLYGADVVATLVDPVKRFALCWCLLLIPTALYRTLSCRAVDAFSEINYILNLLLLWITCCPPAALSPKPLLLLLLLLPY
jgi:hypothetical protein